MEEIVSFNTNSFQAVLPDEYQPNPNVIGFELCWYLIKELASKGINTEYPQSEDWSWYTIYSPSPDTSFNLYVSCPFESEPKWRLILEPVVEGIFKKKKPEKGTEEKLVNALKEIINSNERFNQVVWKKNH